MNLKTMFTTLFKCTEPEWTRKDSVDSRTDTEKLNSDTFPHVPGKCECIPHL